jgi:hypothetical protein
MTDIVWQKGFSGASARGGISETGSDIIPKQDKKRSRSSDTNKIGRTSLAPLARQASGYFPVGKGVVIEESGFRKVSEKPCWSCLSGWRLGGSSAAPTSRNRLRKGRRVARYAALSHGLAASLKCPFGAYRQPANPPAR